MKFSPERLIGLRKAKGIRTQEELQSICKIDRTILSRYEKGASAPAGDTLAALALSLDAEMGYFHGLGNFYEDNEVGFQRAAIEMSFLAFGRDLKFSANQKVRCGRTLLHPAAPRTLAGWRALAEMVDLAIGPEVPDLKKIAR
jgi:transcriptional regulator with XRE-family HTH domain